MRLIITFLCCALPLLQLFAQSPVVMVKLPGSDLWSFADLSGNIIINEQFEKAYDFSADGLAPIYDRRQKEYYFINQRGELLETEITGIKLKKLGEDGVENFSYGFVPVKNDNFWGMMNIFGKVMVPMQYTDIWGYSGGYAVAKRNGMFLILDQRGLEIHLELLGITELRKFSNNLAAFKAENKLYGFVGPDGRVVIEPMFETVGDFSGGLAWARIKGQKVGFINAKGDWAIRPQFEAAGNLDPISGLAKVHDGLKWVYTDQNGKIIHITDTDENSHFAEGYAIGRKMEKFGFYDKKGQWAILPQFDEVRNFKNGYAAVKKDNKWGLIDRDGKIVILPTFDDIGDVQIIRVSLVNGN